ncbi:unnamed protein product [Alopecurus aequalis]
MDRLDEESYFLDELMSLRRPEDAPALEPWQQAPYPVSGLVMSDLLFYGGEQGAPETRSGAGAMDISTYGDLLLAPMPPAAHPLPHHEEFNFDYLSEVCNPYSGFDVPGPGIDVDVQAGQADAHPLHETPMLEDYTSGGDKLHHGGGSSSSPTMFIFGGGGREMNGMIRGVPAAQPRSKLNGPAQSKNLMAERRRRKRLNDRLSMLRSIVPKISKMDRTSILGDTIDYVKELTERIKTLEEEIGATPEELNLLNSTRNFSSGSSNEEMMPMRNSTRFVVEKRGVHGGTSIEICCATNPGVLLSTVNALEVLGLEIEQCVVSCFGDFGMQASCSQEEGKMQVISTDEIKQALYRSAGYGGRCL